MNRFRTIKYATAFVLPVLVLISFSTTGIWSFSALIFSFVLLPILEFFVGKDTSNLDSLQREIASKDRFYDFILYLTVPVQICCLIIFLIKFNGDWPDLPTSIGWISAMGLMCGVFGINIAHELGHRTTKSEQTLAKILLSTSLYLHFFIEHNRGHHRNVGTPEDPASARQGESIYVFWMRSIFGSWLSAWNIVKKERERKKLNVWSLNNEFIQYMIIHTIICLSILIFAGPLAILAFIMAAVIGILLLESVNYIEHYGLRRKKVSEFRYEDVEPIHSWNADFILGRLILFELTRHSDHHWDPSKHYQTLDSIPESSHLPAGYPTMIVCALFPPIWFKIMDKKLDTVHESVTTL